MPKLMPDARSFGTFVLPTAVVSLALASVCAAQSLRPAQPAPAAPAPAPAATPAAAPADPDAAPDSATGSDGAQAPADGSDAEATTGKRARERRSAIKLDIELEGDLARHTQGFALASSGFDPMPLVAGLTHWQKIDAVPTAESLAGRPVLLVSWSVHEPHRFFAALNRMGKRFAEQGLVIVAVHPVDGWDEALELVGQAGVQVAVARDSGGHLAKALQPDGSPDYTLIDRAGRVRYYDITDQSLNAAVTRVVREPDAETARAVLAEELKLREADLIARRELAAAQAAPGAPLVGEGSRPGPDAYRQARWPQHTVPVPFNGRPEFVNVQGKPMPTPLGSEEWITPTRSDPRDHVLVLDFWATWCGPCLAAAPVLDALQTEFQRELMVLAISGQRESIDVVRSHLASTPKKSYFYLHDANQTVFRTFAPVGIPHVVIVSTDGVVRWQGNPHSPDFEPALRQVIAADPWVAIRTEAAAAAGEGQPAAGDGASPSTGDNGSRRDKDGEDRRPRRTARRDD